MQHDDELSDRERLILQASVHSYITSAEPVGSRTIVKRFDLGLSAASVRNVMADLEERGYLQQLHTSSGRVPTDKGYRYYVDYLMGVQELTLQERARIERELTAKLNDTEEIMRQTSHLLALVSQQTGIVEGPDDGEAQLTRIELVPVTPAKVVVMVVDSFGRVRTSGVTLEPAVDEAFLPKLSAFLNENFRGVPIHKLVHSLQTRLRLFLDEQRRLAEDAVRVLQTATLHRPGQLFLDGASHLFEQPEFRDMERAREVFNLLDERDRLLDLLRAGLNADHRTSVLIGREAPGDGHDEISIVTAPYRVGDRPVGMIGVLGPRRMPYWRMTAVVDYTAGMLSRLLTKLAGSA
jgi:heat-inducible transcriptional repressor